MIVFGWGAGAKQLGTGYVSTCGNCNNTNPFLVVESSRKVSVFFVPVAKWDKRYWYICPVCSHGFAVPSVELAQRLIAGAFRNPLEPDAALVRALNNAMAPGE